MLQLNALAKLVKKRKRCGRGGSRGGTSGRGHKGQKARTGDHGVGSGFEGGQMPLVRRLPKRGFNNKEFAKEYCLVHTSDLEKHFNNNDTITREMLMQRGLVRGKKNAAKFIKILHDADITKKLIVQIDAISKSAVQAIEKAGGNVQHVNKEI